MRSAQRVKINSIEIGAINDGLCDVYDAVVGAALDHRVCKVDTTLMEPSQRKRLSKLLSKVLRHQPEMMDVVLDSAGWSEITALLAAFEKRGVALTRSDLDEIITTSDKQRFAVSDDGLSIRANQGHSVGVELGHPVVQPPTELYHGTV